MTNLFSLAAMSDSADMGSPWEPVEMMQSLAGSMSLTSAMSRSAGLGDVEQAHLAGDLHVLLHRQAHRGDGAVEGDGGVGDLLHPVDVAGEAGRDDALALELVEEVVEHLADAALGAGVALLVRVGGVGEQQADALLVGDRADAGEVGEAAVDRGEVELPVAGVQDHALGRVEGGGEPVGHRVGDGDELAVERADLAPLAVVHRG